EESLFAPSAPRATPPFKSRLRGCPVPARDSPPVCAAKRTARSLHSDPGPGLPRALCAKGRFSRRGRGGATVANPGALFVPAEHGFADALHRFLGHFARTRGAFVKHIKHSRWILFQLQPTLANRRDPLDQIVRHRGLALDATDSRGPAAMRRPFQRWLRRE